MNRPALCGGGRGPRRRRRRPAGRAGWLPFLKVRFRLPAEAGWLCVGSRVSRVAGHPSGVRLFVLPGLPVRQVGSGLGEPPAWLQRDGWQSYLILQLGWPLRKSSVRRRSASLVSARRRVKPPRRKAGGGSLGLGITKVRSDYRRVNGQDAVTGADLASDETLKELFRKAYKKYNQKERYAEDIVNTRASNHLPIADPGRSIFPTGTGGQP